MDVSIIRTRLHGIKLTADAEESRSLPPIVGKVEVRPRASDAGHGEVLEITVREDDAV